MAGGIVQAGIVVGLEAFAVVLTLKKKVKVYDPGLRYRLAS